jgi:hypothetical protein
VGQKYYQSLDNAWDPGAAHFFFIYKPTLCLEHISNSGHYSKIKCDLWTNTGGESQRNLFACCLFFCVLYAAPILFNEFLFIGAVNAPLLRQWALRVRPAQGSDADYCIYHANTICATSLITPDLFSRTRLLFG